MPLPDTWAEIPVTGTFTRYPSGEPVAGGRIEIQPVARVIGDAVGAIPAMTVIRLDEDGAVPAGTALPSYDDTARGLAGVYYRVAERFTGGREPFVILVRHDAESVNLATAPAVVPTPDLVSVLGLPAVQAAQASEAAAAASEAAAAASADAAAASADEAAASADLADQARLLGATIGFETKADMDADLAHDAGTLALVTNDSTAANNGTYRKSGASGTGSWVLSADRVTALESDVAELQDSVASSYASIQSRADMEARRAALSTGRPKAAIVILLGQSLNVSRGTKVQEKSWPGAYMFVDGVTMSEFDFVATNAEFATNWDSVASVVSLAEGAGQSPCVGIAATVGGGKFARAYLCSVAVGARGIKDLNQAGMRTNIYAATNRFCDIARADGFDPVVAFYSAHGEADAVAGMTEETYYNLAKDYYAMAQLCAAQAMDKPDYIAPVFLTYPVQQNAPSGDGANDRVIKEAIRRISVDLPGAVNLGGIYQWPCNTDRIHPTEESYVKRGEMVGRAIRAYFEQGVKWGALHITDVTLSGTEFVATFSAPVVRDATLGVGESLNAALANDGFEWLDNGTGIAISTLSYEGWKVRGTLASAPVGTIEQQVLRIAEQATTGALTAGVANLPGSLVREDSAGWKSVRDHTYVNYNWAAPQSCSVRAA